MDPASFWIVLGILKGTFQISIDALTLSRADLALVKSTTRYLLLDDIHEELSEFETGIVEEYNTKLRQKDETIQKANTFIFDLQHKADVHDRIQSKLENLDIKVVECQAYQTHRSFNKCAARSIIIGSVSPEGHSERGLCGPCGECANDCSRLRGCMQMPGQYIPIGKGWELGGFISQLENIHK